MSDTTMSQRGDQTLIGDKVLVDLSHFDHGEDGVSTVNATFKVYQLSSNSAFPATSSEEFVWTQAGSSYPTNAAAVMAGVNLAASL